MKHTPGPWKIIGTTKMMHEGVLEEVAVEEQEYEELIEICAEDGAKTIAYVTGQTLLDEDLIAAAPQLYEACKDIVDHKKLGRVASKGINRVKSYDVEKELFDNLEQALAAADGKE